MIVKNLVVSKRPQREEPCVIKESDLELLRDDLVGFSKPPKLPVRVIMNNSTISIFESDNFGDILFSCTLDELHYEPGKEDDCIKLTNIRNNDKRTVCAMEMSKESMKDQITSWNNNINMFKNECRE